MNELEKLFREDTSDNAVRAVRNIRHKLEENKQDIIDNYQKYIPKTHALVMAQARKERFDNRFAIKEAKDEMRLNFLVPRNIYMANPEYWSMVCKDKKLRLKYPEFVVGD